MLPEIPHPEPAQAGFLCLENAREDPFKKLLSLLTLSALLALINQIDAELEGAVAARAIVAPHLDQLTPLQRGALERINALAKAVDGRISALAEAAPGTDAAQVVVDRRWGSADRGGVLIPPASFLTPEGDRYRSPWYPQQQPRQYRPGRYVLAGDGRGPVRGCAVHCLFGPGVRTAGNGAHPPQLPAEVQAPHGSGDHPPLGTANRERYPRLRPCGGGPP